MIDHRQPYLGSLSEVESMVVRLSADHLRHADNPPKVEQHSLEPSGPLFQIATANEVAPHVCHTLRTAVDADELPECWSTAHDQVTRRIDAYMESLDELAGILASSNIPLVALKNAGIARGIYPCRGCCPMGDLDVLIRPSDFRTAHEIVLASGFKFAFRSPLEIADVEHAEQTGGGEYCKTLPSGEELWLELQWRPVAGRWICPDQEPNANDLIDRSLPIKDSAVRLLAPEDNLLQVALHTAKHTYVRAPGFRLHTDIDRIVSRCDIDWDVFVKRVKELSVKTATYFSLAIPREILGTPIPNDVLAELAISVSKRRNISQRICRAGLLNPNESKFSRLGYLIINSLMYDDLTGWIRSAFPPTSWMQDRYNVRSKLLLPYYYGRRLTDLLLRRSRT